MIRSLISGFSGGSSEATDYCNLDTLVLQSTKSVTGHANGITISMDGMHAYHVNYNLSTVFWYTLSVPFDFSTAVVAGSKPLVNGKGICVSPDGTFIHLIAYLNDVIRRYNLSIPFDITTAVLDVTSNLTDTSDKLSISYCDNGKKALVVTEDELLMVSLTTAYDITGGSSIFRRNTFGSIPVMESAVINNDGTVIHFIRDSNKSLYRMQLNYQFDISSFEPFTMNTIPNITTTNTRGIYIDELHKKLYTSDRTNPVVRTINFN